MARFVPIIFFSAWCLLLVAAGLAGIQLMLWSAEQALAVGAALAGAGYLLSLRSQLKSLTRKLDAFVSSQDGRGADQSQFISDIATAVAALDQRIKTLEENRFATSAPSILEPVKAHVSEPSVPISQQIAKAILSNRIDLHVQSVHALPSRQPVFFECLSRLRNEHGETLYPSRFIEHATRSKLMSALDNFLLLRCLQIVRQFGRRAALEPFFVNLSASSLRDPQFLEQLSEFLQSKPELKDALILEVNAAELKNAWPEISFEMTAISKQGYAISLDDFDPGEDITEVAAMGARYVKIPASNLDQHSLDLAALKSAGITPIATRVEDEKTLIDMIERGLPYGQGFVFGKPRAWDDVLVSKGLVAAA